MFREHVRLENLREVVEAFEGDRIVHAGEDVTSSDYVDLLSDAGPDA